MRLILTLLMLAATTVFLPAQRTTSADLEQKAQEIRVLPADGEIGAGTSIRVSFPTAMVAPEKAGMADESPPFRFTPELQGAFAWESATEARFQVAAPIEPGQAYTLTLHEDLTDLRGDPIPASNWKPATFEAAAFEVDSRFSNKGTALAALPEVDLQCNYSVRPADVLQGVYFQNRGTRERHRAAIILPEIETRTAQETVETPDEVTHFFVRPAEPLPVDGTYDLIVDGLIEAGTGTAMPGLKAVALGSTQSLVITEVEVHTYPLEPPGIILRTTGPIDHETLSADSVMLEPPVEDLTFFADEHAVRLQGDFDTSQTYEVTLGTSVKSKTGYPVSNPGPHEAVFDGLQPMLVFPQAQFYQRSRLGLHLTMLQSNCPETDWRLARVPLEKLHKVRERLKEFQKTESDPFTGETIGDYQTELLTDALELPLTARGSLPGTTENEARYREIRWQPETGGIPPGAYLLEASATLADGRIAGNRSLLFFNEVVIHRKLTADDVLIKVFTMESGKPVAQAGVEVIDDNNRLLASGVTGADGSLALKRATMERAETERAETERKRPDITPAYIVVKSTLGGGIQPYRGARFIGSGWASSAPRPTADSPTLAATAFADRNLYRPGDPVHVKGTLRWRATDEATGAVALSIPQSQVSWSVHEGYDGPALHSGEAPVDAFGGWEATWTPPKTAKLGSYRLRYGLPESRQTNAVFFQVEEYKPPLFTVELTSEEATEPGIRIASHYFHGSPNAGALIRWEANWSPNEWLDDGFQETDHHSPHHREHLSGLLREGEMRLDTEGTALIDLEVPYERPWSNGSYRVNFAVEVIAPEGQTMEAGEDLLVRPHALFPSIRCSRAAEEDPSSKDLLVDLRATDAQGKHVAGVPLDLTIYRQEMQSVKERLGPNVYRYRNFPLYHTVESSEVVSGDTHRFTPVETAHYIAYAKLKNDSGAPGVSDRIHALGDGVGRYHAHNDGEITLELDRESYTAGQEAQIALDSPFGGQAWVCVETDRIIDQFLVDIPDNSHPIKLPIKSSYHPNIHVSVYLLHPGGTDQLPRERFGTARIDVERPDLKLNVTPELIASQVEPGDEVSGTVRVFCQGQAVPNADVTVFAVDEAVHRLGGWTLPDWYADNYPNRYLSVASYRGLDEHYEKFEEREVTEKGFLIGGYGEADGFGGSSLDALRRDFRALAFWKTQLRTDAQGETDFSFQAPDNLTSFHLVAVAQTKSHQFGEGEASLKVAKKLMIEPALTRFVRQGDELELRAVIRQNYLESATVVVHCDVEGDIEWLAPTQEQRLGLSKGLPQVVRFPCRVLGGDTVQVRFQAQGEDTPELRDAVEVTLPVGLPGIMQRTGHFGVIPGNDVSLALHDAVPEYWRETDGNYRMTVSYTPYLPELKSLPEVLDYPHGCLEQKATRYLTYGLMTGLLDYLPEVRQRHANYRQRMEEGLITFENAMQESGFLPYWEGSTSTNDWVTIMAYWFAAAAKAQGLDVPEHLNRGLEQAHAVLVRGQRQNPDVSLTARAFALFVHAETGHPFSGMEGLVTDLYARRGDLDMDGLSFLTLAMNRYGVMPQEQEQLGKVLSHEEEQAARTFDPVTFGSRARDRALSWLTRLRLASPDERRQLSDAYLRESENTDTLLQSTQENFWNALLLNEFAGLEKDASFADGTVQPEPDFRSANDVSLAWNEQPLDGLRDLLLELGPSQQDRYYMMSANVLRGGQATETREDRGFRFERVVSNLTEPERFGTEGAPFAIGDELLITYRFDVAQPQHYVALTDELPAGIETVNFNLPQVAAMYRLPPDVRPTLRLDHSELRDQSAHLYFNTVPAGSHTYAVLARVTASGTFIWPAGEIVAMYQPHFGGLTATSLAHSRG